MTTNQTIRERVSNTRKRVISQEHFAARAIDNAAEALALVLSLEGDHMEAVLAQARELKAERYDPGGVRTYSAHEDAVVMTSNMAYILLGLVERMDGADDFDQSMLKTRALLEQLGQAIGLVRKKGEWPLGANFILSEAIKAVEQSAER